VTDAAAQPAKPVGVGQAAASGPTRVAALGPVPEPSPVAALIPSPPKPSAETLRIVDRAREMIRSGDISAARLLLERAVRSGSPQAAFFLAETYDPQMLAQWGTFGIRGDVDKARDLYGRALKNGIADSKPRLEALR
jgi:TPR repeat protein